MKNVMLIGVMVTACVFSLTAMGQDQAKGIGVEITGKNVNLLKAVCGADTPEADSALGSMNALIVKEAKTSEGKDIEGLAGKLVHYLPVAAAAKLISGEENVDKMITIKGKLYKDATAIAVESFEVKAAAQGSASGENLDEWDELGVTTMSQQQVI